jgi:Protein of unknown function DUF262
MPSLNVQKNNDRPSMLEQQPIDLGDEPQQERELPLEVKYREQMRQIISQKIELPISTIAEMIERQINLSPDFQRRDRWSVEKQSRFIESIIMNVPIPPVFLGEDDYGNYVVLDGRQRLTAVNEFIKNIYPLKDLRVWSELNGLRFADLERRKLNRTIIRRFIPAVVILKESSPEVKYDVFDRLNTGGVVANEMEIRNAIFQGKFNTFIHRLSDNLRFREIWGIPTNDLDREADQTYRTMKDVELVLRFFALQDTEKIELRFKDHLSAFMGARNKAYHANPLLESEDQALFLRAIENCWKVFGVRAFQRETGPKSAPLADAMMNSLSLLNPESVSPEIAQFLKDKLHSLFEQPIFLKSISSGTNGKGAIRTRIEMARQVVRDHAPKSMCS